MAVICGGEDTEGVLYSDCFYHNQEDNIWVYLLDLEIARGFAAAEILDGCLYVSGGKTEEGQTAIIELLQRRMTILLTWRLKPNILDPDIPFCGSENYKSLVGTLPTPVSGKCLLNCDKDNIVCH